VTLGLSSPRTDVRSSGSGCPLADGYVRDDDLDAH